MRRVVLILVLTFTPLMPAAAQAVIVDAGAAGHFGVALVPGTNRAAGGIQTISSQGPCSDPWLAADLGGPTLPSSGLCWHGGSVMHRNEMFDLAWDPLRRDWASTRNYVERYLRDVADGSNTLTSPYAVTTQYHDGTGRAQDASLYGGACIDYGNAGGASCQLGSTNPTGAGANYPASGCPVTGTDQFHQALSGAIDSVTNDVCLTDAQLKAELATMVTQEGLVGRAEAGFTPTVVLMTPAGVVDCLDAGGVLCSANNAVVPPLPSLTTSSAGGSLPDGGYQVKITYVKPSGETVASAAQTISTTGTPRASGGSSGSGSGAGSGSTSGSGSGGGSTSTGGNLPTSTVTVASPPPLAGATGWYAYVTQAGGATYYLQQAPGSPTALGQSLLLRSVSTAHQVTPPVTTNDEFCAYHSSIIVGSVRVPYIVQPWTALTGCDEPDATPISANPSAEALATAVGQRLVSPLSQAQIASIVDPGLDGWSGLDGSEINDNGYPNGCVPFGNNADSVTVGAGTYQLQREFNNAGVLESDPNAPACAGIVALAPRFVVPSAVDPGDVVAFDGSKTVSTLMIPRAGYAWNFGDGTGATGPSVVHTYAQGGTFTVTLTATDRGGNVRSLSQTVTVGAQGSGPPALTAHLQLLPQSWLSVLRSGLAIRLSSNMPADGIATLTIPRSVARRAHLRSGRGSTVVIGRGTVPRIQSGMKVVHIRISAATARKLTHLHHLTLTLRLTLVGPGRTRRTIDAAGSY